MNNVETECETVGCHREAANHVRYTLRGEPFAAEVCTLCLPLYQTRQDTVVETVASLPAVES